MYIHELSFSLIQYDAWIRKWNAMWYDVTKNLFCNSLASKHITDEETQNNGTQHKGTYIYHRHIR